MTTIISILFYVFALVWTLLCFALMVLLWLLTVAFDSQRVVIHHLSRFWAKSYVWLNPLWRLEVTGKENVDRQGCYVITVNHQSLLDIPLMYAMPKVNFKWVSKSGIYKWPIFGQVLWMHGDITVKQGSVKNAKSFFNKGAKYLSKGTSIMIFPEGTRSKNCEVHKFKEGAFILAKEAGVELLPCVLDGARKFIKGWRLQRTVFRISIMPPLSTEKVSELSSRELMNEVHQMTVSELKRLREI